MRYTPTTAWGGTDAPTVPVLSLTETPGRNYADLMYAMSDLAAFRALDHLPVPTQEDGDSAPVPRLLTRRLLGALTRPLSAASARLDALPARYDPARPESLPDAAFHLRLSGYPLPTDLPDAWAGALLRALPELLPVGRVDTYLRTAEVIYGRGQRTVQHGGEVRHRSAVTARGVTVTVSDAQPAEDGTRVLRITVDGPASDDFLRLLAALRPAAFSARPTRSGDAPLPLLPFGVTP